MIKIKTAYDARNDSTARDVSDAETEVLRVRGLLSNHPEIGVIIRNGKPAYYVGETVHADIDAVVSFITVGR